MVDLASFSLNLDVVLLRVIRFPYGTRPSQRVVAQQCALLLISLGIRVKIWKFWILGESKKILAFWRGVVSYQGRSSYLQSIPSWTAKYTKIWPVSHLVSLSIFSDWSWTHPSINHICCFTFSILPSKRLGERSDEIFLSKISWKPREIGGDQKLLVFRVACL